MKKIFLLVLTLALSLTCVVSCSGNGNQSEVEKPGKDDPVAEQYIYNSSSVLHLVYDPEILSENQINTIYGYHQGCVSGCSG